MSLSSINRNMLRLTGLSSGMDTESIVTSLLNIDQMKVDKQFKVKTKLEWKGDAYRDFNLKLRNFREKYMSVLNPQDNVFTASAYNSFKTNMVDNSEAFTVSAGSNANVGSMVVNEITQLASSATAKSQFMFTGGATATVSLDTKLKDAAFATGLAFASRQVGTEVDEEGDPVMENYIAFSINGKEFEFKEDSTFNEIATTVNRANVGVNMSYSSLSKGFTITAKDSGAASKVEITNIAGNAFATTAGAAAFGIAEGTTYGQNAKLKINGIDVERNSNSFSIDGIQYTLKKQMDPGSDIKFNVERDIEPTFQKIKSFIEGYNQLIADLQTAYEQKPNRDYAPLTDNEKDSMTEKEAEKWEALAKEGMLYRDSNIGNLLSTMRGAFYSVVEGAGKSAADIGLRTSDKYYEGGKIVIDETALREALNSNPEQVKDIFTKLSTSTDSATASKESGLVVRLQNALNGYINTVTDVTLQTNSRQVTAATSKLEQLEDWIITRESAYWRKFTAMETAMASLQSQTSSLAGLLNNSGK